MNRAAGQLQEIIDTPGLGVKGKIRVELLDDRGKVTDQQEADNYVNQSTLDRWARWSQILLWSYGQSPATTTKTSTYLRDPRVVPRVNNDHLACWTDATAEDPTDKHIQGEIIAWAHRWIQSTSPAIRQGIVVPSLCTLAEDEVQWAWEWGTTQGNGTFQSIGWTRLHWDTPQSGDPRVMPLAMFSKRLMSNANFTATGLTATQTDVALGTNISRSCPYYDSDSGKLFFYGASSATIAGLVSVVPTFNSAGYDISATTSETANAIAAGIGGNGTAYTTWHTMGLTRLGPTGDWIAVGSTSASTSRRPRVRRITPAGATVYTNTVNPGVESLFTDVTYTGTDLYAIRWRSGVGAEFCQLDPATGDVSSIISITGLPSNIAPFTVTGNYIAGVEWDSTNSCFWFSTVDNIIFNTNVSGAWLGVMFRTKNSNQTILTLTSPHSGDTTNDLSYRRIDDTDSSRLLFSNSTVVTGHYNQLVVDDITSNDPAVRAIGIAQNMISMDGEVWLHSGGGASGSTIAIYGLSGFTSDPNFTSRSLLGAPVVKTVANSMRITYAMQFT